MRNPKEIIINNKTLEEILVAHKHWIFEDCDGWQEMRADLRNADLRNSDLRAADLRCAKLSGANLGCSELSAADLYRADLSFANLGGAIMNGIDLISANLSSADLSFANLGGARLCNANLSDTNLRFSYLNGANLSYADLNDADLSGTELNGVDLSGSSLHYAKNLPYISLNCPSDGAFVGWKKVSGCLIKLEIPEDAKRSSATSKKCRCSKAKVLGIFTLDGKVAPFKRVVNYKYTETEYVEGEMVYPDGFDGDRFNECSNGIHFFINKQDAIDY